MAGGETIEITCDRDGTRPSPAHASERGSLPDRVGASTLHAASEVAGAGDQFAALDRASSRLRGLRLHPAADPKPLPGLYSREGA